MSHSLLQKTYLIMIDIDLNTIRIERGLVDNNTDEN